VGGGVWGGGGGGWAPPPQPPNPNPQSPIPILIKNIFNNSIFNIILILNILIHNKH